MWYPSHVVIPDSGAELLRIELAQGFSQVGCRVSRVHPASLHNSAAPHSLLNLADSGPFLLFSVNFQGLNPLRDTLKILKQSGSRVAVWCVDNPWNQLAGIRDPGWKTLPFFVTDASFTAPLKKHGASLAQHLPLAASPELFGPDPARRATFSPPDDLAPFVFVGRSAFPGKEAYFAGQSVPGELLRQAEAMLPQGLRPDLFWWERELGSPPASFWPGKTARRPALGAETSNLAWRSLCLRGAALAGLNMNSGRSNNKGPGVRSIPFAKDDLGNTPPGCEFPGLDIFGDSGWQKDLPSSARLRPPVDYYARLPGIYSAAKYSLCPTSLQLPEGLTQRHFDVWTAGGVCLSDATPGLGLFPKELVRPIVFRKPKDIGAVAEKLEKSYSRQALTAEWQNHLRERHTYAHRALSVLEAVARAEDVHCNLS